MRVYGSSFINIDLIYAHLLLLVPFLCVESHYILFEDQISQIEQRFFYLNGANYLRGAKI